MADLPSFDDMRSNAFALLGDAEDELRSDWRPGTGPTRSQGRALREARHHIALAKNTLDDATGDEPRGNYGDV